MVRFTIKLNDCFCRDMSKIHVVIANLVLWDKREIAKSSPPGFPGICYSSPSCSANQAYNSQIAMNERTYQ